ncbi:hypothetical protein ACLKMH_17460 [Psychromonas sp. KJ10-10]
MIGMFAAVLYGVQSNVSGLAKVYREFHIALRYVNCQLGHLS